MHRTATAIPARGRYRRRSHDGQLPVESVVVQQRGVHQTPVPVAGKPLSGAAPGTAVVHVGVRHHQRPVPERVHRPAKEVSAKILFLGGIGGWRSVRSRDEA